MVRPWYTHEACPKRPERAKFHNRKVLAQQPDGYGKQTIARQRNSHPDDQSTNRVVRPVQGTPASMRSSTAIRTKVDSRTCSK